jgi:hypothetical protein
MYVPAHISLSVIQFLAKYLILPHSNPSDFFYCLNSRVTFKGRFQTLEGIITKISDSMVMPRTYFEHVTVDVFTAVPVKNGVF